MSTLALGRAICADNGSATWSGPRDSRVSCRQRRRRQHRRSPICGPVSQNSISIYLFKVHIYSVAIVLHPQTQISRPIEFQNKDVLGLIVAGTSANNL
jgi:hypothetical protein